MRELQNLPNRDGFEFIGIKNNGEQAACHIHRREDGIHVVAGEACFADLIGWLPKPITTELIDLRGAKGALI